MVNLPAPAAATRFDLKVIVGYLARVVKKLVAARVS
jgi:hypothetical protein